MKFFSSKRRVAAAVVIVLALFLLRPGASRLKSRIASSLSAAVARPVEIGSVHLRLLPRPGFDLENLVVYDDPAFGAEPMLRAGEVTADVRLISLMRGRLEIARLEMSEPSLNLVRAQGGRWNLEALLERTARTPLAPTAKGKSEPRTAFPYIEATSARINFKVGSEKKPYALTNADFSLWQDSENAWGVRLKAQPIRADLNLNDTGLLQVNGTWQRAATLRDTPLQFSVEWSRAQLGQLTKLFTGNDQGWRGGLQVDVALTGTPAKLEITSDAALQDLRHYDITRGAALRLAAHCDGQYSSLNRSFSALQCSAPVGNGLIALTGDMGLPGSHNYRLALTAENVPASAMTALVERVKNNLPDDLDASGTMRGSLKIEEPAAAESRLRFEGQGEIADFRLSSAANKAEIGPETVPFVLTTDNRTRTAPSRRQTTNKNVPRIQFPQGPHLEIGPFPVAIGRAGAPTAIGWINRSGFKISISGETEIAKALPVARTFGLPALQSTAEGAAQVDLQVAGSWAARNPVSGFPGPQITGTVKMHNVRVAIRGTGEPVEISAGELQLLPDEVRVSKLNARAANTLWTGSLEMPRGCGAPAACEVQFTLSADQIALGELSEWVDPRPKKQPWYHMLDSSAPAGPSFLGNLRASGRLRVERLQVRNLAASHVSASVKLDRGKMQVSELNADVLDGKHRGEWQADFTVRPAVCSGKGSFNGISLIQLAQMTKDNWIDGTANGSYEVRFSCSFSSEFWPSAEGTLRFDISDGSFPHISLGDDGEPLKIARFLGQAGLHAGTIEIKDAKLDSPGGKFQLTGTASSKRDLDLKLRRNSNGASVAGFTITGTLAEPRVVPLAGAEQARLKPEAATRLKPETVK